MTRGPKKKAKTPRATRARAVDGTSEAKANTCAAPYPRSRRPHTARRRFPACSRSHTPGLPGIFARTSEVLGRVTSMHADPPKLYYVLHAPRKLTGTPTFRGREPEYDQDVEYGVRRVVNHRLASSGIEYEVEWEGLDASGDSWPNWWVPKNWMTDILIATYRKALFAVESKLVSVDMKPLVYLARKSVAHAVALAKTKARPRQHLLTLDALAHEDLAKAFLNLIACPGKLLVSTQRSKRTLPIQKKKDSDGTLNFYVAAAALGRGKARAEARFCPVQGGLRPFSLAVAVELRSAMHFSVNDSCSRPKNMRTHVIRLWWLLCRDTPT